MARIAGIDIPREKRLEISLTYIFGIGRTTSQKICDGLGLDRNTRVRDLTDEEVNQTIDRVLGDLQAKLGVELRG